MSKRMGRKKIYEKKKNHLSFAISYFHDVYSSLSENEFTLAIEYLKK